MPKEPDVPLAITDEENDISFQVRLIAEVGKHLGLGKNEQRKDRSVDPDFVSIRHASATLVLLEKLCDFTGRTGCRPWVRAQAVFALGRLCLGAKPLTWTHSPSIVGLANSKQTDVGLRRDAIVVVFDMLKMFGDVIEKDLGLSIFCTN